MAEATIVCRDCEKSWTYERPQRGGPRKVCDPCREARDQKRMSMGLPPASPDSGRKTKRGFATEKHVRVRLTRMLGDVVSQASEDMADRPVHERVRLLKELADTCNKINGNPTTKIQSQMMEKNAAKSVSNTPRGQVQFDIEKELDMVRNASNSITTNGDIER